MKINYYLIISFLLATLLFPGCSAIHRFQYHELPAHVEEEILSHVFRTENRETLRALASIRIDQADGPSYSMRFAMAVNHPSFLRMDSVPSFGVPDFFMSLRGNLFSAYVPGRNRFYTGTASKYLLASFLGIHMSHEEIISLVSGKPVMDSAFVEAGYTVLRNDRGNYRIEIISGSIERTRHLIRLNSHLEIEEIEVFDSHGRLRYVASFSDYGQTEGLSYPRRIKLNIEEPIPTLVDLRLSDILVTMNDDPSLFDLSIPAGAEIIHMD